MSVASRTQVSPPPSAESRTGLRILNVGISLAGVCGVRDYSRVLSDELGRLGGDVQTEWLDMEPSWGPRVLRAETRRWLDRIDGLAERTRPDWILWHYSVFSYSYRGVPILSGMSSARFARGRVPVIGVLHEFVYPFRPFSPRGLVYAVAQRAALRPVYRNLAAAVVTTDDRVDWLEGRRWLPRRRALSLPVPATTETPKRFLRTTEEAERTIAIVGFASANYLVDVAIEAVRLAAQRVPVRLCLIGAPGADGVQGRAWRQAASRQGIDDLLEFTGLLEPSDYAAAIDSAQLVLFPDSSGPSSRKTTLAAALAAGKPVVAIDGPARWQLLVDESAALLVPPDPYAIADAIVRLCDDPAFFGEQGRRAELFYRRYQAREVVAGRLLEFLAEQSSE